VKTHRNITPRQDVLAKRNPCVFAGGEVTLANQFTNAETRVPCESLVIIGTRFGNDALYAELRVRSDDLRSAGIRSVTRSGDALAPGAIVHAVYSGQRYAREVDADPATLGHRRDAPLERRAASPESGARLLERPATRLETLA
jgi:dimethylamine/trimethylamine dehydrogenase